MDVDEDDGFGDEGFDDADEGDWDDDIPLDDEDIRINPSEMKVSNLEEKEEVICLSAQDIDKCIKEKIATLHEELALPGLLSMVPLQTYNKTPQIFSVYFYFGSSNGTLPRY